MYTQYPAPVPYILYTLFDYIYNIRHMYYINIQYVLYIYIYIYTHTHTHTHIYMKHMCFIYIQYTAHVLHKYTVHSVSNIYI